MGKAAAEEQQCIIVLGHSMTQQQFWQLNPALANALLSHSLANLQQHAAGTATASYGSKQQLEELELSLAAQPSCINSSSVLPPPATAGHAFCHINCSPSWGQLDSCVHFVFAVTGKFASSSSSSTKT
ncbi:hypothetical protein ACA910_016599 [Epithemia clementina (nom. ined.)]